MKRSTNQSLLYFLLLICLLFLLSACGKLETIKYDPPQTPDSWLKIQPHFDFSFGGQTQYFMQPSTTFWVYLLGVGTIALGFFFLKQLEDQRSRLWWGIAMLLWGLGAMLAGTSYEAFSYAIKCAGQTACLWTSWWEVLYLIVTVWSFDAIFIAVAYSSSNGTWQKVLIGYSVFNALAYLVLALAGSFIPVKFWISFEMLILVAAPGILIFFILNTWRYFKFKTKFDLVMIGTWLGLGITTAAYFLYYVSGTSDVLWAKGIWFTENDVLHLCLIAWMTYIWRVAAPKTRDLA